MSNHAGQYFMPGRSCRMPARRRLSGDARLLARLAAACRAVWQALLVRAQAPLAQLARAAWRWRAVQTRPGSIVAGRAAGCTASSVKCSLAQQHTPCLQQLAPRRARQQAVSGAMLYYASRHIAHTLQAMSGAGRRRGRAHEANAACRTTPATSGQRAARSTVGPEPKLCPYSTRSSGRTPRCCVSHLHAMPSLEGFL